MPPPPPPPLRVLLVDDEPYARLRLRTLIGDLAPLAEVAGEAGGADETLAWLERHRCDLVLLDVQMPGRDGLTLAAALKARPQPPAVVFVTAHAAHAVAAFELEATDYLTKPVRRERLEAALRRVAQRAREREAAAARAGAVSTGGQDTVDAAGRVDASSAAGDSTAPDAIVVSERGRIVRVPLADVLYLKAELKYVTLRTAGRAYLLDDALADLEQRLGPRFLRVHRNALVARDVIRSIERRAAPVGETDDGSGGSDGWAIRVAAVDEWLAVSRRQLAAVRDALLSGRRQ